MQCLSRCLSYNSILQKAAEQFCSGIFHETRLFSLFSSWLVFGCFLLLFWEEVRIRNSWEHLTPSRLSVSVSEVTGLVHFSPIIKKKLKVDLEDLHHLNKLNQGWYVVAKSIADPLAVSMVHVTMNKPPLKSWPCCMSSGTTPTVNKETFGMTCCIILK